MTKPDIVVIIAQNQPNNINKSECLFLNIFELSRQPVGDMINFRRKNIFPILILFVLYKGYRTSEIRISTPDRYSYRYLTGDDIPTPNTTYLSFQVQACNDAHIALKSSGRKPLEVVLGGWSNSKSCFRTEIQGSCRTEHRGRILDCGEFQTFWIDWTTRRIRVGKTDNGIKDPLLTYRLNAALSNVEIGITTGFGASGVWVFQGTTTPTPSVTTAATLSSSNSQLAEVSRGASTGEGNSVAVPITLGILSVVAVVLIGVFVWRKKFYKPYGHTSDVQMINPMYHEKEMNTYEIIRRSHPEDNMYTDLSPLDVTKIGDTHGYYDVEKPVQEPNTYASEHTNGQSSRYPRNSRSSRVFGQTHYDEIPGMENQTAEGNQQKYHIDDTYLMPQPSVKRR